MAGKGLLNDVARTVGHVLIGQFSGTPLTFTRVVKTYNPLTGVESRVDTPVDLPATPALRWTEQELRDDTLRRSDLKVIVSNVDVEAGGVNIRPTTEEQVFCVRGGVRYRVLPVSRVAGGDDDAVTTLGLRR